MDVIKKVSYYALTCIYQRSKYRIPIILEEFLELWVSTLKKNDWISVQNIKL